MTITKSYNELITLPTFEERVEYLKCYGGVGQDTFGFDRYLNQMLYKSKEWKDAKQKVILRDNGCDLGVDGYDIPYRAVVHHINPITVEDLKNGDPKVLDPNNLITTTLQTHNLIHYGIVDRSPKTVVERAPHDTCPWRK